MTQARRTIAGKLPFLALYAYLFFLSIDMMGGGMKASFKHTVKNYLHEHAADFTELVSFVIGVLGTSLVQSSSTVTAMAVVMAQEGIVPLLIAIGIVHGANLGTSVTSSLVAFATETRPLTGRPLRDLHTLLFAPRLPGFHRAVSTGVVHGLFNVVLVTLIILTLEIPFGLVAKVSSVSATFFETGIASGGKEALGAIAWVAPKTYTKPVVHFMLESGIPGWALVVGSLALLFGCIKGFASTMRAILMADTDAQDFEALGQKFLGRNPADTFLRGLVLTILVQSSSATTALVVPLAAMGFFRIRQIFPFIMGANIGTTVTALLAAASAVGTPGFHAGMTIALSHFYLNSFAVFLVVTVPGLYTSIMGATTWLADRSAERPIWLLGYLASLSVGMPLVVYLCPTWLAMGLLGGGVVMLLVGPHLYLRSRGGLEGPMAVPVK